MAVLLDFRKLGKYLSEDEIKKYQENFRSAFETLSAGGIREHEECLGWFTVRQYASREQIARIKELAEKIRREADAFVVVGVGGSNQAARAVIQCLSEEGSPSIYYAGNTLAPYELKRLLEQLKGKSVYINIIAKNFSTLEPGVSFRILRQMLSEMYGTEFGSRIIATGTRGEHLEVLSGQESYTFLLFPDDVGGRYSAFCDVGLLPMAVAGIDIEQLIDGAAAMEEQLKQDKSIHNMAFRYAAVRNLLLQKNIKIELLSFFEPRLRYFAKWWVQMFAESEGKDGKGIYPSYCEMTEDLHSVGQYIQDGMPILFETFLNVTGDPYDLQIGSDSADDGFQYLEGKRLSWLNRIAYEATCRAHGERLPCLTIDLERLDAFHYGQLFYFFMFSCYVSCSFMGVNPFDQPGVEHYKAYMFQELHAE